VDACHPYKQQQMGGSSLHQDKPQQAWRGSMRQKQQLPAPLSHLCRSGTRRMPPPGTWGGMRTTSRCALVSPLVPPVLAALCND
jgi:hypothetical protein